MNSSTGIAVSVSYCAVPREPSSSDTRAIVVSRTSKFVAHDESNAAKVGDRVAIVESRPLSKRKRWVVTRVVRPAVAV